MTLTFEFYQESADCVQHVSIDDFDAQFVRPWHGDDWLDGLRPADWTTHVSCTTSVATQRHRAPVAGRLGHDCHFEADLESATRRLVPLRTGPSRRRRGWRGSGGEVVQGEVDALSRLSLDDPRAVGRPEPRFLGRDTRQKPRQWVTVVAGQDTYRLVPPTRCSLARLH